MKQVTLIAITAILLIAGLTSCNSAKENNDQALADVREDIRFLRANLKLTKERDSITTAMKDEADDKFTANVSLH